MVFKRQLTPLGKGGKVVKHDGKGALEQRLLGGEKTTLTKGKPLDRSLGNYAKDAPPTDDPFPVYPSGV